MAVPSDAGEMPRGRTTNRVRYPETDRMGVAHHTHFLVWFELGRTELMRNLGCRYAELEDRDGVMFPVVEASARYHAPARYDEIVEVDTVLVLARGARVRFEYEVRREADGTLLARGATEHAAVDRAGKTRRLPEALQARLAGRGRGSTGEVKR